jgi:phosphatidylinositol alpha-1,6-mannosyltransferase
MSEVRTKTLVVTNDFPPRPGGIQAFVHNLAIRLPPDSVVVYAPAWRGAAEFDAAQPFPVVRHPTSLMLPEPRVLRRARDIATAEGCDSVLYGAAAPLGLLTRALRGAGIERFVALTHGHEAGWAQLPLAGGLLRRIGDDVDVMTYLGEYTRSKIVKALSTVSRLVARKGQDTLIHGWPRVLRAVPDAALLLVGGGPYRTTLERLALERGVAGSVRFTGSVPWELLPAHYDAGDVFAMPCRTRRRGLDVEGLGIVYLEASATGLPVVAGDSGGAPEAVVADETGLVVPGRSVTGVADAVISLLRNPARAAVMGEKGRSWVEREWRWEVQAGRLGALLTG